MGETFQKKSDAVKKFFSSLSNPEAKYSALIEMGRKLPPLSVEQKSAAHLVPGCQSNLYLVSRLINGRIEFGAASDALISAGLAALLISVYSGESPEIVLKEPPRFLDDLGIHASLSPNRSNGLSSIHLKMRQEALKYLMIPSTF